MYDALFVALGLLFGLVILGLPLAVSFFVVSGIGAWITLGSFGAALFFVGQSAYGGVREYVFVVLPLFTAMGLVVGQCGAARDLFNVVNRVIGRLPGRLAVATIGGNAIFAAVTGVGIAAAAAFSHIAYPAMRQNGYRRSFALGCIAGSSVLGLLIPPSIFMIIWAILTEQSVGRLFIAGIGPGLMLTALYVVYAVTRASFSPSITSDPEAAAYVPRQIQNVDTTRRSEMLGSFGVLVLVVLVMGGIWSGIFTPTEASAFGLFGSILLGFAKGMSLQQFGRAVWDAGLTTAPILLLLIGAKLYSRLLALEGIPGLVQDLLLSFGGSEFSILLFIFAVWLVLGMFIDSVSIMLLTVPIFWPIAQSMGQDPIVFALIGIFDYRGRRPHTTFRNGRFRGESRGARQ
jgi:C4-dicarboxylate transporter, DctM subunit